MVRKVLFDLKFLLLLIFLLGGTRISASHLAGGNFEWECVGQDSFMVTLKLFRDCSGIGAPGPNLNIQFTSPCGTVSATLSQVGFSGVDVSQLCPTQLPFSTCQNGSLPGMEEYIYQGIVHLTPPCSLWTMGYQLCCRNTGNIGNMTGGQFRLEAQLNNQPSSPISASISGTDPTCSASCDGSINVSVGGGIAPYTFEWPNNTRDVQVFPTGATATSNRTGICAGTHIVTITDANNCSVEKVISLEAPARLSATGIELAGDCGTGCTGRGGVKVSGGTAPYTLQWPGFSQTGNQDFFISDSLCAGNHFVTVVDDNGCQDSAEVVISGGNISLSFNALNLGCADSCNSEYEVFASGGAGPYLYSWSSGSDQQNADNLCPGTYVVTVTDAGGCRAVDSITVVAPDSIEVVNPAVSGTACSSCNGTIDISNISGGTAPYNFAWDVTPNPGNTAQLTGLCQGMYTVTITDAAGCSREKSFGIHSTSTGAGALTASMQVSQESCPKACDGSLTVVPSGGTPPYSISWNTGNPQDTNATVSNLCAGIYGVIITDSAGCIYTMQEEIKPPHSFKVETYSGASGCGSCSGTAKVNIQSFGSSDSYSVLWSNSETGTTIKNLCSGTYTVTVTNDTTQCTLIDTVEVSSNISSISASFNTTGRNCANSCDGIAEVIPGGGTAPYQVIWGNGDTGLINTFLCLDTVQLTIIDAAGCVLDTNVVLPASTSPPIDVGAVAITNTDCGAGDGQITAGNVTGGTPPYQYRWNTGPITGSNNISNLEPGVNRLIVFDANGCSDTTYHEVENTGAPNFGGTCLGNNSPVFAAQPIPYVCAGQTVNFSPSVTEPDGDSLVFSVVQPVNGNYTPGFPADPFALGPANYSFNSSNGQMTFTPTVGMVASGPSHVVVIQVCEYRNGALLGCVSREFQFVVQNCQNIVPTMTSGGITNFSGTATLTDSNEVTACVGDVINFDVIFEDSLHPMQTTGDFITLTSNAQSVFPGASINTLNGDSAVFSFSWIATQGASNRRSFTIDIEDDACPIPGIGSYSFDIRTIPSTFVADDTLCGFSDTVHLEVTGGDTFTWRVITGDSMLFGQNFSDTTGTLGRNVWVKPSQTTTYEVTSNLDNLCKNIDTVTVYVKTIDVSPDTMLCRGDTMTLGATGMIPCANGTDGYFWSPTTGLDNPNSLNPTLTVGAFQGTTMYTLVYDDGCGCQVADSFLVEVSEINVDSITWDKPVCGDSNATLEVHASGGFGNFAYSFDSTGVYDSANIFQNLSIGYYEAWAKDSLGCVSLGVKDTIQDPGVPEIVQDSIAVNDVTCFGAQNGSIDIFATGGAPPLQYSIDTGNTYQLSSLFQNLDPDTYSIAVTDDFGCTTLPMEVIVETNDALFLDSVITRDLECFENDGGRIQVYGRGGTAPLEYSINNGAAWSLGFDFDSIAANNYVVIVRDSFGCTTDPEPIVISQPDELLANLTVNHDTCFEACGGKAQADVTGGTPPYTFNWNGYGANTNTSWNLCSGPNYMFDVTDGNGCETEVPFNITQPDELIIDSIVSDDLSCNGNKDGRITIHPQGGKRPYSYSIDGGQNFSPGNNFTGLEAGRYEIIVRDSAHRCEVVDEVLLIEPDPVILETPFSEETICVSNCINLSATASGGTGNTYDFIWTGISNTGSVQSVCPGQDTTYAVYAEDVNGCVSNVEIFEIKLHDSLKVTTEKETEICPGDTVFLSAIGEGGNGQGFRYEWTPLTGLSAGVGQSINAYPNRTTTYTVRLSDACGSPPVTDTIRVNVREIPEIDFTVADTTQGCEPFNVTLVNQTEPVQFVRWDIGDFSTTGFSVDMQDISVGSYDVTMHIITPEGCEGQLRRRNYLRVYRTPEADFYMDPNPTTIFSTNIQFRNQSSTDVVDWQWNFAGQDSSFESNPRFMMSSDTGTFPIHLRVENRFSCWDEVTKELIIGSEYNMFVPNAFTPNSDGLNDVFAPVAIGVSDEDYTLQIFNRWGQIIFESNSLSIPWDGRIQSTGELAPGGVYIWKIIANDNTVDQTLHEKMGSVTLIR